MCRCCFRRLPSWPLCLKARPPRAIAEVGRALSHAPHNCGLEGRVPCELTTVQTAMRVHLLIDSALQAGVESAILPLGSQMFQSPLISPRGNTAEISTPRRTRQSRTPDSTAAATARAVPRDERVATTSAARGADAKCASAAGFVCVFVTAGPITKLCPILFVSAVP